MLLARARHKLLALALLAPALGSLVACAEIFDPPLPANTRGFAPPAVYSLWWSMTEQCSGLKGSMNAVDWYVVPGEAYLMTEGRAIGGYWSRGSNRIVLAEGAWQDGGLVRHEMLHALLRGGKHPRKAFLERCGGIVVCVEQCLEDAGPAPQPAVTIRRVVAESLATDVRIDPPVPAPSTYDGHFMLTVTATNPYRDSIRVVLPPSFDSNPSASFSYELTGNGRQVFFNDRAWDNEVTLFGPGETKREVFDLVAEPLRPAAASAAAVTGRHVVPGTYLFRGAFGLRWTNFKEVVVK